MQLKEGPVPVTGPPGLPLQGHGFHLRAHRFLLRALLSPYGGPLEFSNCQSGASIDIGLGLHHINSFYRPPTLDGPAIRNAIRGDSRESIRANQFAEKPYFHNVRAIRANHLNFESNLRFAMLLVPRNAFRKNGGSIQEPFRRFARIGPSKPSTPVCTANKLSFVYVR